MQHPRFRRAGAVLIALITLLPAAAHGRAGALDKRFGGDGKVTTPVGVGGGEINDVVTQSDRKIVAVGYAGGNIAVARYRPNGGLDTTFGGDGLVTTPVGSGDSSAAAVAIQPNGKILVAGSASNGANDDFALVRYKPGGGLDMAFDGDGKVMTPIGTGPDRARAVAIQADGKIVVAGSASNGSDNDFAIARYLPNGALDGSFDTTGKVMVDFASDQDQAFGVAVRPNGKILLGGSSVESSKSNFAAARLNPDGSPDLGFGGTGTVTTAIGSVSDGASAVAVQRDGRIVLAGSSHDGSEDDFAVVRYRTNGDLDASFGGDGKVTTAIGAARDTGTDLAMTDDGRILVAGIVRNAGDDDFGLVRYRRNGNLDTAFSFDGKVTTDFAGDYDDPFAVTVQSGGKVVVAGSTSAGDYIWALARYKGRTSRRVSLNSSVRRPPEGGRFKLSGKVRSADRLCRARVKVRISRDVLGGRSRFKRLKTVTTRVDGRYRLRRRADKPARYRAQVAATDSCAGASAKRTVRVS